MLTVGILAFIGAFLPIARGTIDFGFFYYNIYTELNWTIIDLNVIFNPLLNKITAEWFDPLNIYVLLGITDQIHTLLFNFLFSIPMLTRLAFIILLVGIAIAVFGLLKLLKALNVIGGADAFLGSRSLILPVIFFACGGLLIVLLIVEFFIFKNKIMEGIATFEQILRLPSFFLDLTTQTRPLAGFYLILIPALGVEAISIYLLITARAPEEAPTRAK